MHEKDITIIIVNYNVKDFLFQCLRSIEKTSQKLRIETIVVDNNSTDGSVDYLKNQFSEVEFIALNENLGFGKANNIGIARAKGKYTLILNPDTIIDYNTFDVMYDYMESNADVGIAGCKVLNPDGSFQLACRRGFPTPWASFCKLFGLQKLFPKSKLFAQYNQTFKSIDETYFIDAVIGAFMFARTDIIREIGGFDPSFFMYGEDLDLCYRVQKHGFKVAYIHSTSIIHYKGESTKRSSINEVKHFYQAMEIFANKHFAYSSFFLFFLRIGIFLRSVLAYLNKSKRDLIIIFADLVTINFSFILATKIRFGSFFILPEYAYPTVFIVLSCVIFLTMFSVGEYFESKPTIRRSFFGLMISFFVLSSLTYFFKEYAFSRGILLMTIGFTVCFTIVTRALVSFYDRISGNESDKRIAIIGLNEESEIINKALQTADSRNANLVGFISVNNTNVSKFNNTPIIGNVEYLSRLIDEHNLQEVIITDKSINMIRLMQLMENSSIKNVRFHIAQEYDDVLSARIINEVSNIEPTIPAYNITKLRYRITKRTIDILFSILFLTIGIPFVYLLIKKPNDFLNKAYKIFIGKCSFIGLYALQTENLNIGKLGLLGLAHISKPERLSKKAIDNLNKYYIENYSLYLDIDIFLKYIFRKNSAK